MEKQLTTLPRQEIARASIENFGAIYVAEKMADAIEAVNSLAPEHLEIVTKKMLRLWLNRYVMRGDFHRAL